MGKRNRAKKKAIRKVQAPSDKIENLKVEENWDDAKPEEAPVAVNEWEEDWLFGDLFLQPEADEPAERKDFEEER